jgi:hypothetical protein
MLPNDMWMGTTWELPTFEVLAITQGEICGLEIKVSSRVVESKIEIDTRETGRLGDLQSFKDLLMVFLFFVFCIFKKS